MLEVNITLAADIHNCCHVIHIGQLNKHWARRLNDTNNHRTYQNSISILSLPTNCGRQGSVTRVYKKKPTGFY